MSTAIASREQLQSDLDADIIQKLRIPPRPEVVALLHAEANKDDPSFKRITEIIGRDPSLVAALLKAANSPFFGLNRSVGSIEQALTLMGLSQAMSLVTGFALRNLVPTKDPLLTRFWDACARRGAAMAFIAQKSRRCPMDLAHIAGMFLDVGIPIMANLHPSYLDTLQAAGAEMERTARDVEHGEHGADHASVGVHLALEWNMPDELAWAIELHHDMDALTDDTLAPATRALVAAAVVADELVPETQGFVHRAPSQESLTRAMKVLRIDEDTLFDWRQEMPKALAGV
ncbi:HDOD domain-containing protein [Piscinibacterium candidicorallinum]|jgi:HD-like signal output (HDOD) protein|uniref:HDOD domain-containing protein n=1 Tax=Piscinibacterium candidicorallinum TaxID=1793872 RepID=A0ABV7GXQ2_9BURK